MYFLSCLKKIDFMVIFCFRLIEFVQCCSCCLLCPSAILRCQQALLVLSPLSKRNSLLSTSEQIEVISCGWKGCGAVSNGRMQAQYLCAADMNGFAFVGVWVLMQGVAVSW